jgi:hypothetical protein
MNFSTNVFQKMKCCAICRMVKLIHQNKHFQKMNSIYNIICSIEHGCTPYGITNFLLSNFTTTSNGKNMFLCLKCYNEYAAPIYGKYVVINHQCI